MKSVKSIEAGLILVVLAFSLWLMFKSFSYDPFSHTFLIGRHEVGDFGLHLALIRSFSWGRNFPVESPFFPGQALPYHYYIDLLVGLLEGFGVRIDLALNSLSCLAFALVSCLIYKLTQLIFGKNLLRGITAVLLFILPGGLSFWDYINQKPLSPSLFSEIWKIPDLINKGPFDGSLFSIYFTQVVWLNQRHLIFGIAIGLVIIYYLLNNIYKQHQLSLRTLVILGVLLGIATRIHALLAAGTIVVVTLLLCMFNRLRWLIPLVLAFIISTMLVFFDIFAQSKIFSIHAYFQPGFLSSQPFTTVNFLNYWWLNIGLVAVLTPIAVILSNKKQQKIFCSFLILFIVANVFQLSFRIEHNHSLINYFLIIANCYAAFVLVRIWAKGMVGKILYFVLMVSLTLSGTINLMAIKNDFHYPVFDAPTDKFISWIKDKTARRSIFLSRQDLYDPVILAGRRSYFGATYYLQVMGYDYSQRQAFTKLIYEAADLHTLNLARKEGINYVVIPLKPVSDFNYSINLNFFRDHLTRVYQDTDFEVFEL